LAASLDQLWIRIAREVNGDFMSPARTEDHNVSSVDGVASNAPAGYWSHSGARAHYLCTKEKNVLSHRSYLHGAKYPVSVLGRTHHGL
jgi:hypothetical protein